MDEKNRYKSDVDNCGDNMRSKKKWLTAVFGKIDYRLKVSDCAFAAARKDDLKFRRWSIITSTIIRRNFGRRDISITPQAIDL